MIRVLVADDHAVVRRGVAEIITETEGMTVVAQADTGRAVIKLMQQHTCDVILLDIAMPDGGGLETLQMIKGLQPAVQVLVLSMYPEKQYARRALSAGAAGYLTKESAPDELVTAIRKVAGGGKYITLAMAEQLAADLGSESTKSRHEVLSNREYQVMCLLAQGHTVSEIAEDLALSVKTISTYRTRILDKLQFNNTAEIIRYAIEQGLVD